jgi:serine protease AprX
MRKLLLFLCVIFSIKAFAQAEDAWLFLKDKPNSTAFLDSPLMMLSQKAIERRQKLNISLDEKDVPIYIDYYNQLKNEGNIVVLGKSKWLNAVHIQGTVSQINGLPPNFPFIDHIEFANKSLNTDAKKRIKKIVPNHLNKFTNHKTDFNYGSADNQIKMLKGDVLHQQGLTGKGQIIAVIDAGFPNVNTLDPFKRIRENNQILGGYNFADRNDNFYSRNNHGTHVLSTIAGYIEDEFVGTAPDAKFYLFISEIAETETVLEETLWVEAAERADSLGVNVINTSLGYTTYDNPNHSHSYEDMDGKTTFISRGAEIAASRGMLLVNSVGNSGNSDWKYMGAPADAPSVIAVGAVDASGNIASFSSFGPTADNRIKPEILAQGANSVIINFSNGEASTSSGTSFSGPIMAGLIACLNDNEGVILKSASKKSKNLIDYLKEELYKSADRYNSPTNQYGYGIPNFEIAFTNYSSASTIDETFLNAIKVSPNPVTTFFEIEGLQGDLKEYKLKLYNVLGKVVYQLKEITTNTIDVSHLKKGLYLLKISKENLEKTTKIIKQ